MINFVSRVLVSLISRQERTTLCATAAVPLDKVNVGSGNKIDQQQIFSVLRNFNARVLNMKQMMMKSTQKFAHAAPVIYDLVSRSYHFLLRGMRRGDPGKEVGEYPLVDVRHQLWILLVNTSARKFLVCDITTRKISRWAEESLVDDCLKMLNLFGRDRYI